jgi:hypothetical protein
MAAPVSKSRQRQRQWRALMGLPLKGRLPRGLRPPWPSRDNRPPRTPASLAAAALREIEAERKKA